MSATGSYLIPVVREMTLMPLSNLLKSAAGTCPFCSQKAGILSREQPDCRRTFQAGWNEIVRLPPTPLGRTSST